MLWLAFLREMCVLGRDNSSCGHAGGGGGDPREWLQFSRLPARLCARLAVASGCCSQVFHTIHSATQLCGSPAPPPRSGSMTGPHKVDTGTHTPLLPLPKDKKPGLGYNLKPTTDTKLFSRLQKPCVLQHSQKGYSYTKSAVSRDCSSWTMRWPLCTG